MKRNMNLIRDLLISIEEDDEISAHLFGDEVEFRGVETRLKPANFIRHCELLVDEGFAVDHFLGKSLTWKGHEFLSLIRDEEIWAQLTDKLGAETLSGASISVIEIIAKELALDLARKKLSLQNPPDETRDAPTQPEPAHITQGGRE